MRYIPLILYFLGAGAQCPESYTGQGSKCYRVTDQQPDWAAARRTCQADAADLASITSAEEASAVTGFCINAWTGLNDLTVEGQWTWISGTSNTYILSSEGQQLWSTGQPDNYLGQDCVAVTADGNLDDFACTLPRSGCCQFVPSPSPTATNSPSSSPTSSKTSSKSGTPSRTPSRSITPSNSRTVSPSPSPGYDLLSDQVTDFSATQHINGWTWGYYYGGGAQRSLYSASEYSGGQFRYGGGSWCRIGSGFMHPNSGGTCSTPSYGLCKPSVLWINPEVTPRPQYKITFSGTNPGACGSGTSISLIVNELTVFSDSNTGGGPLNSNHIIFTEEVPASVELISDPSGDCNCDGLTFALKVYGYPVATSPTPTPTISDSPSISPSSSVSSSASMSATITATQTSTLSVSTSQTPSSSTSATATISPTVTLGSQGPLSNFICEGTQTLTNGANFRTTAVGQNYVDNFACTTYFTSPPGRALRLTLQSVATEPCCDFFTVYDGYGTAGQQLLRVSGSTIVAPVFSSGQALTVVFSTDYSIVNTGVAARVEFVDVSPSPTPSRTTSRTASQSPSASQTASSTVTGSITASVSATETSSPSLSPSESASPSVSVTPTSTVTSTISRSGSVTPSTSSTNSPSVSPSTSPSSSASPSTSASTSASISTSPSISATSTPDKSWSVTATITASPSTSSSTSQSPSETPSASVSPSETTSPSITPSRTITKTTSRTPRHSLSTTRSITVTATVSATITPTISVTQTVTWTPGRSRTPTTSRTASRSISATSTPSKSQTATGSSTKSQTISVSATGSVTISPSISPTESSSASITSSGSRSPSITVTVTATESSSNSPSTSVSISPSISVTMTTSVSGSSSYSPSISVSVTSSITPSPSRSTAKTISPTSGLSPTGSPSTTSSYSPSTSVSSSSSSSPSLSPSQSLSVSVSVSVSITGSKTVSLTVSPSQTLSNSATLSASISPSGSITATYSSTHSVSVSPTATSSRISAKDIINSLPLTSFTTDTIAALLTDTLPPLDRLAAGFFATNPDQTTATFMSGNLTLTLSRLDPTEPLALNAGASGAVLPALPGVPADSVVYLASQPFSAASAAANNLTGSSVSLGVSSMAGNEVVIHGLQDPIIVKFAAPATNASALECAFYNETSAAWATDGCQTVFIDGSPTCQCNHMTEFGLRFKAIAATNEGIFTSLSKLLTYEGLMAALPIIILIAAIGGSLIVILIVLRFLDHRAFKAYAVALDSSAELELLRSRIREMRPDQSWDCLKIQGRHSPVKPGFNLHKPPSIPTRWYHLIGLWLRRLPYQHPWFGLFTRFDPAMPRIYRGILLSVGLLTSVSLSILFYGYSNGAVGDSTLPTLELSETIVLSLITTAASVPVAAALSWAAARSGQYEFGARYPYILAELTKLRHFVNTARSLPREQLVEEMALFETKLFPVHPVDDIYSDPTIDRIDFAPDAAAVISATITADPALTVGITGAAQAILTCLCSRAARASLKVACCPGPQIRFRRGILQFINRYTHVHVFRSRAGRLCGPAWLPIHTPVSTVLTILLFAWMGGCCTYILGFTSYQSADATFTIFKSVAISQLTSNLIVGPALQFISLLLPYWHNRHDAPEEAIFLPLEVFEFKVFNSFVARASSCNPQPLSVMQPEQIMKKLDTDLSEEGQRLEARLQNIFWAID